MARRRPMLEMGRGAEAAWEAVLTLGVTMIAGYYLDEHLDGGGLWFFLVLGLGLVTAFRRLWRLTKIPPEPPSAGDSEDPPG